MHRFVRKRDAAGVRVVKAGYAVVPRWGYQTLLGSNVHARYSSGYRPAA